MAITPPKPTPKRVVNQYDDPAFRNSLVVDPATGIARTPGGEELVDGTYDPNSQMHTESYLTTPENDPSPIGSGNWIGDPNQIVNAISSLPNLLTQEASPLSQMRNKDWLSGQENNLYRNYKDQLTEIDSDVTSPQPGGNYQENAAYLSTLAGRRQAEAERDWELDELRQNKDREVQQLERRTQDDVASRRATLAPEIAKIKAIMNSRGILTSSSTDEAIRAALGNVDDYAYKAQRDLQDRVENINATYTTRVNSLGKKYKADIGSIETLLTKRFEAIQNSRAMTTKAKSEAKLKVMQEYRGSLTKLQDSYNDMLKDEENEKQKVLDNELKIAGVTGMFRGSPTLAGERYAADQEYRQQQLQIAQTRLAMDQAKAGKKGSGGGSSSGGSGSSGGLNDLVKVFQQKTAEKIDPKVAESQVLSMITGTKNKAALRSMIESGPAQWQYAEGPVMPGEEQPLASAGKSWSDFVNPKSSPVNQGEQMSELDKKLLEKFLK